MKRLPVVNFAAGGIATPSDAALMMHLGCDGIFVGSGIFKSKIRLQWQKLSCRQQPISTGMILSQKFPNTIGEAMKGLEIDKLEVRLQERGN